MNPANKQAILDGFGGATATASTDPAKASAVWDIIIQYLPQLLPLILTIFTGGGLSPVLIGAILKIIADALGMLPQQAQADIEKALNTPVSV